MGGLSNTKVVLDRTHADPPRVQQEREQRPADRARHHRDDAARGPARRPRPAARRPSASATMPGAAPPPAMARTGHTPFQACSPKRATIAPRQPSATMRVERTPRNSTSTSMPIEPLRRSPRADCARSALAAQGPPAAGRGCGCLLVLGFNFKVVVVAKPCPALWTRPFFPCASSTCGIWGPVCRTASELSYKTGQLGAGACACG